MFNSVRINTCAGAKSVVGDRYSWTLEELWDVYHAMPEDSTIFDEFMDRFSIFIKTLCMSLDGYVDWETGQCDFDREDFLSALEYVKSFPAEVDYESLEDPEAVAAAGSRYVERMKEGRQMLSEASTFVDMQCLDTIYGEPVSFVGYPTADGSTGSAFVPVGNKMAISSACKDKEAAWEIVRSLLLPRYSDPKDLGRSAADFSIVGVPINLADHDIQKQAYKSSTYSKGRINYFGMNVGFHKATEEELQRFEDFLSHIEKIELYDCTLLDLVWDSCGAYFAGHKSLDDTIALIENRVGLYVNEVR